MEVYSMKANVSLCKKLNRHLYLHKSLVSQNNEFLSSVAGCSVPRVKETEVWKCIQDSPARAAADPGHRGRECAEASDGRAQPGHCGLAPKHQHSAWSQQPRQLHRGHPSQKKKGKRTQFCTCESSVILPYTKWSILTT